MELGERARTMCGLLSSVERLRLKEKRLACRNARRAVKVSIATPSRRNKEWDGKVS